MRKEIVIPDTADGALDVTITNWLRNVGDRVQKNADLVEATTEKITLYATSSIDGTLVEIIVPKGEKARVGQTVGYVEGD